MQWFSFSVSADRLRVYLCGMTAGSSNSVMRETESTPAGTMLMLMLIWTALFLMYRS